MPTPQAGGPDLAPGYAVVPGLQRATRDLFDPLRPSEQGICALDSEVHVTLPIPAWGEYQWVEQFRAAYAASTSTPVVVATVPPGERWWLWHALCRRDTGDNNIRILQMTPPDAYCAPAGTIMELIALTVSTTRFWWPDIPGRQTVNYVVDCYPVMMEPGTTLSLTFNGSGSVAGDVTIDAIVKKTRIAHVLAPGQA